MTLTDTPRAAVPVYRGFRDDLWSALWSRSSADARAYREVDPFPHAVFDDVFPDAVLDAVREEWPERDEAVWLEHETLHGQKLVASRVRDFGPTTRALLSELNAPRFVD